MKKNIAQIRTAGLVAAAVLTISLTFCPSTLSAAEATAVVKDTTITRLTDSIRIAFPVNSTVLDVNFGSNKASFSHLDAMLNPGQGSWTVPQRIVFTGAASPDGSVKLNSTLSAGRSESVADYLSSHYSQFASVKVENASVGRDWDRLLALVKADPAVPFKDKTVALLQEIVSGAKARAERDEDNYLGRLQALEDGHPYEYLKEYVFPKLRSAALLLDYDLVTVTEREVVEPEPEPVVVPEPVVEPEPVVTEPEPEPEAEEPECKECRPFYMDINTNMLYDLAMTPNIGAEFYLGRGWTIGADWQYAWWKNDDKAFYWRIYGGDLVLRKYFGKKAKEKPLQGHHLGLYGQMFTYDFEFGNIGRDAAKTDGTVLWHWGAGLEYGYTLPVAPRLNIDFSIGVGYAGGKINKYDPDSGHYYWEETHRENYVGPTRASIGLIWLIGCGNYNHMGRKADK